MASTHHRFSAPQRAECRAETLRKPDWLKVPLPDDANFAEVDKILSRVCLSTVCRAARCPNQSECWSRRTATFLVMGDTCTRACRFCHVATGSPLPLDPKEPDRVASAVKELQLKYAVITSVDRDDLPDGGAAHCAKVVQAIRRASPETAVEILIPDFGGSASSLALIAGSGAIVVGHNLETVARLTPSVRDRRASYEKSLEVLRILSRLSDGRCRTKSSLMLGLGETRNEVLSAMDDLRDAGVSILTLGQYLQPSPYHLKVERFITPAEFSELRSAALKKGFSNVASGPLVRSSFRAEEMASGTLLPEKKCPHAAKAAPPDSVGREAEVP